MTPPPGHRWMRIISPEMLLLVPILWFLPRTGAAPSGSTEQLDTGVVSFLPFLHGDGKFSSLLEGPLDGTTGRIVVSTRSFVIAD